jgi:glycosyltransferase involved in cell wall biosynthesis
VYKISVVIPVYNAENFIVHILDKIYAQTFQEFELICINDGSTDNTKEVLEKYAANHDNMRIINQINGGIGNAGNNGIINASGKYLCYIEHDDSLSSNQAFEIMYNNAEKYNLDILSFNFSTEVETTKFNQPINKVITGKEYLLGTYHPAPWCKFYNLEYLRNINFKFREDLRFADTESYPRLMFHAKRVMHIEDVLYIMRLETNKGSVSKTIMNIESANAFAETAITYSHLIEQTNNSDLVKALKKQRMQALIPAARILGAVDSERSKIIFETLLQLDLSQLELILFKNEYKFFYYQYVQNKSKYRHPIIYLLRRFRKLMI